MYFDVMAASVSTILFQSVHNLHTPKMTRPNMIKMVVMLATMLVAATLPEQAYAAPSGVALHKRIIDGEVVCSELHMIAYNDVFN